MKKFNISADLPDQLPDEFIEEIIRSGSIRVERIVSRGHTTPDGRWYRQEEHEWVFVVSGGARLAFRGEPATVDLGPGDHLEIPSGLEHRVSWTDPDQDTIWIAVFYP